MGKKYSLKPHSNITEQNITAATSYFINQGNEVTVYIRTNKRREKAFEVADRYQ